jgi:nitroreductase
MARASELHTRIRSTRQVVGDHRGAQHTRDGYRIAGQTSSMETWDAITARRNVRDFDERPLSDADLDRILEAGRRAPSSRNWQPWDFVVVTDREQLRELSNVWRGGGHVAHSAATIALILPRFDDAREHETALYDLGQATMAIQIAAADLGVGAGHSAVADQDQARRVLGLPEDCYAAYLVDLGYPADRPLRPTRRPNRRAFDEVVHRGRW